MSSCVCCSSFCNTWHTWQENSHNRRHYICSTLNDDQRDRAAYTKQYMTQTTVNATTTYIQSTICTITLTLKMCLPITDCCYYYPDCIQSLFYYHVFHGLHFCFSYVIHWFNSWYSGVQGQSPVVGLGIQRAQKLKHFVCNKFWRSGWEKMQNKLYGPAKGGIAQGGGHRPMAHFKYATASTTCKSHLTGMRKLQTAPTSTDNFTVA